MGRVDGIDLQYVRTVRVRHFLRPTQPRKTNLVRLSSSTPLSPLSHRIPAGNRSSSAAERPYRPPRLLTARSHALARPLQLHQSSPLLLDNTPPPRPASPRDDLERDRKVLGVLRRDEEPVFEV